MENNTPEQIHLIFKTHLDIGFTDFARNVIETYFRHYIPQAIKIAHRSRQENNTERFIWTVGSWLIYAYLEQCSPSERVAMEDAILAGDIVWHGLPFTTHSELMDRSLFEHGLSLSQRLDRRFGKRTIAAKMTDVPGHTRGIVPLLAEAGIQLLHIGVNPASTAPDVPPVFVWRDPTGADVMVIYESGGYGGFTSIPGLRAALAFAHTNDNMGPQSYPQVQQVYQQWHTRFPDADIHASTLDAFAQAILPYKHRLPVVTQEISDTWIHGVGTDPTKVSQFRELLRLRRHWISTGQWKKDEQAFERFSTTLLLIPEHTWGLDEKEHLDNYTHYTKEAFALLRGQPQTHLFESSWQEQRDYIQQALQALGTSSEAQEAHQHLHSLAVQPFTHTGFVPVSNWRQVFTTAHFLLSFDQNGAINLLTERKTGRLWASDEHRLGLFQYETFSASDYQRFWETYCINPEETSSWSLQDFTKPGIEPFATNHKLWQPLLTQCSCKQDEEGWSFLLELAMPDECVTSLGAPATLSVLISAPNSNPHVTVTLQWFQKSACRLPEALWFTFDPCVQREDGWLLEKLGQLVSPLDIVPNGNQHLHALDRGGLYTDDHGTFALETRDAPLVATGLPALLSHHKQTQMKGLHVALFNNIWGTNFPMWYEEDARFRFVLTFQPMGIC